MANCNYVIVAPRAQTICSMMSGMDTPVHTNVMNDRSLLQNMVAVTCQVSLYKDMVQKAPPSQCSVTEETC